jgi:hypothetical protein
MAASRAFLTMSSAWRVASLARCSVTAMALLGFGDDEVGLLVGLLEDAQPGSLGLGEFLLDLVRVGHGLLDRLPALLQNRAHRFPAEFPGHAKEHQEGDALGDKLLQRKAGMEADILKIILDVVEIGEGQVG